MAKRRDKEGGIPGGADHTSKQDAKMGNITTAASSTMGPVDFSQGYAPNEGELLNKNFASRGKGK
jgi:hypothetical protein